MTKKRIRYSELGKSELGKSEPGKVELPKAKRAAPKAKAPVSVAPVVQDGLPEVLDAPIVDATKTAEMPVEVPVAPRPRRNSTPVELARALAAAQAREAADAVTEAETLAAADATRPAPVRPPTKADLADVLVFRVGTERFAVDLLAVVEVIDLPVIHHVPEMPPAMVGVVTVRGTLTAVYSPHQSLGLSLASSEAVLIFRRGGARVGILIDDVEDAIAVDLRELRRAPGTDGDDTLVLGVVRHEGALLAIVDADALIAACQSAALLETA
jgi:purine-binding chemotaxis protein CheW